MIARVTLEIALRKEFDYLIPAGMRSVVEVGSRVKVPFGSREVMGVVTGVAEKSEYGKLRSLVKVVGTRSLVTPAVLRLARWMAAYYCCPVEVAIKSVLPDAVRKEKEGWRERLTVRAVPVPGELPKLSRRQMEIWNIIEEWRQLPLQELLRLSGATAATVRRLEDKGLVTVSAQVSERDPYAQEHILPTEPLVLNPEQSRVLEAVTAAMDEGSLDDEPGRSGGRPGIGVAKAGARVPVFLLHGVTGSGKTEVYLQAIAHALRQGKGAVVLVPEISLTPQTVERFKARFSAGACQTLVAVLHSHLSSGERHDEWHKIRQGRARIVIGARSAIFAPVEPLGLIIVDEEHENSYKQEEAPRYHARDVAVVRGQMAGAVVLLGSATPSLESYANARRGKYRLVEMPTRVDDQKLPAVKVVDMRREVYKQKGPPIFSRPLLEAILKRLERREQVILFLNRRGYATCLQCTACGYVAMCPHCSIARTYHRQAGTLVCHLCGQTDPAPVVCPEPSCRHPGIRYSGLGTQRVEETLARLFPQARICRMDSDALRRKEDYRRILGDFRVGKIDILVGTQMIAKGLHFPNVTLVGIVHADLSLHIPDFRAGERTFQLLTQVAGRAGRGDVEGEVIVQSFTPYHPSIQFARRHDYEGFFEQELAFRKQLDYPPLSRLALITIKGRNEDKVRFTAQHVSRVVEEEVLGARQGVLAGPAAAPLARVETYYRYQMAIRTRQMARLGRLLSEALGRQTLPEGVSLAVDIDPVNLM